MLIAAFLTLISIMFSAWWFAPALSSTSQTLAADRVTISTVTEGVFDDFIGLRAVIAPLHSIVLDAVEGGRVEKKLVEDGAMVSLGQPLVVLANSSLQLEVIRSESEVTNQLNNLRTIEISLERNRVENERALNEIEWQLKRISQKQSRDERLAHIGFVAPAALQDAKDEEVYWRNRLDIARRGQRTDEQLQTTQALQLRTATKQLQANLALARGNLNALTVTAPIAGRLTAFEATLGQSLNRGQRLGQIDSPDEAKLIASVDEYYLQRVHIGQTATLEIEGKSYALTLKKTNPQVRGGQFECELVFQSAQPMGLRRGQTVQIKLALGGTTQSAESKRATLLSAGAFLTDSGGSFVFVVDGENASKREISLGRRNVNVVEVLSGLKPGERVLTSSYAGLLDKTRLIISR